MQPQAGGAGTSVPRQFAPVEGLEPDAGAAGAGEAADAALAGGNSVGSTATRASAAGRSRWEEGAQTSEQDVDKGDAGEEPLDPELLRQLRAAYGVDRDGGADFGDLDGADDTALEGMLAQLQAGLAGSQPFPHAGTAIDRQDDAGYNSGAARDEDAEEGFRPFRPPTRAAEGGGEEEAEGVSGSDGSAGPGITQQLSTGVPFDGDEYGGLASFEADDAASGNTVDGGVDGAPSALHDVSAAGPSVGSAAAAGAAEGVLQTHLRQAGGVAGGRAGRGRGRGSAATGGSPQAAAPLDAGQEDHLLRQLRTAQKLEPLMQLAQARPAHVGCMQAGPLDRPFFVHPAGA